jgi:hypothetical protein
MEIEKGEILDWVVEDKYTLTLKRAARRADSSPGRRRQHA